jgi:zinc protease
MKKITLSILTLALAVSAYAQKLDRSIRPKAGPAPEITLGKTESFTMANGMRVFVVENHKLPTVSVSIQLDIKPELEGNAAGYREMMSEILLSGTKSRSKEKLNAEIDYIGANINASDDGLFGSSLKKHQAKLLDLMSDIAINSDINKDELEKIKKRTLSGLQAAKNEPDQMLENVSAVMNFGTNHPYGEVATENTVNNITVDLPRKYYSTYFRPNVAYMAIVGDVTMAEMKPLIEKHFGSWQKAAVPSATYSNPSAPSKTKVAFVPRDAAVQSVINVTYPIDLKPGEPDVIKSRVANSILGGGSNGRLFLNLREKHAWTYGSYSSINQDELKGQFTAYAKCRNAVSDSSVNEIIAEMRRMQNEKVGKEELQNHLANLSGAFAIGLESPQTVAQYAINIERYKMPADYYKNYLKNLNAVTAEDIQGVAKKYINPDKANIVVVGSKDEVAKTLTRFAANKTVELYDNYGQPIKATETAAAPTNLTAADVLKKHIAAIGGEKAIMSVKDIKTISKAEMDAGGGQMITLTISEMKKAPNKMKSEVTMMGMVVNKVVFDGAKGYKEQQGQKAEMSEADIKETKADADIYADLHPEQYGFKRTLKGVETVDGVDAYVIDVVDINNKKSTEYYNKASGFLMKQIGVEGDEASGQTMTVVTEYSDYKEVGGTGYKVAHSVKQSFGPQAISAKVETVEINKGIPDTEFN